MLFQLCNYFKIGCDDGGDFVLPPKKLFMFRIFPVAGIYEYHNPLNGASGRITVIDER